MRAKENKILFFAKMISILLLLVIFEMSKLPKPILKIRDSDKEIEKEDFLKEYSRVVDDAIKVAEDDLR